MMTVRQLTTVREQLWLLAHDDRNMRPLIDVRALAIGLAAAVLTDLMLHDLISLKADTIHLGEGRGTAGDPITAGILTALDVRPAPRVQDVLQGARPDLPEDPRNPYQRLYERTAAAMVATDILVPQRRAFRTARYHLVDPSLATWTRQQFNRRLVYPDGADELTLDVLCALAWGLNLHERLLMPYSAAEAGPILLAITDHIPQHVKKKSPLAATPHLARHIRTTIGDLATAAF